MRFRISLLATLLMSCMAWGAATPWNGSTVAPTLSGSTYTIATAEELALRRAKAVARLLEHKGISRDRMKIQSFGSSHPYRYNKPASPKDRRVEIIPD